MAKTSLLRQSSAMALVLASAAAAVPAMAWAQDDEGDETIIITATRRAETVQDVPINIAAVGETQIEEQGFDEMSDFLAYVPGINIVDRGGRQGNPIIVRGINADPLGSGDGNNDGGGTVATYVGEVPLFVDLKLNDMERVEVLLGPQGTLYGAGTLGGAIRYIPKKPDPKVDSLSVRSETYKYSEADDLSSAVGFTFNKSLSDTVAIRGSMDYRNDSGFIDQPFLVQEIGVSDPDPDFSDPTDVASNLYSQRDVNDEETVSGRVALRWLPTDWLDGTLTYYYQEASIGGRTITSSKSTVPAGEYESGTRVPEPNTITNDLLALEVIADLGFAELTSATGISHYKDDGQRDQTDLLISLEYSYELFPSFTAYTHEVGEEKTFNQEVRLVSTTDSMFNWIVGAFYNEFESYSYSAEYVPGFPDFATYTTPRPDALEYFSYGRNELVEQALFGEVGVDLFEDRLHLTAGGRYYDYELKTIAAADLPLFEPLDYVPLTLDEISDLETEPNQSRDGTLYKFNASYDVTDDILAYFTISEGYRIGASNGIEQCEDDIGAQQNICALAPGQAFGPGPDDVSVRDERAFGPDQTTNYEFGVKSTLLDNTLILNGAVYYIEWVDPQLTSATVVGSQPITVNAKGAESKGFELSANWQPTPAFNLRGSYSYVQSELTDVAPDLIRAISPPGFGTAVEDGQPGDRLPGSPENQFSVFASYDQPFKGGDLTYNFGYSYQDDIFTRTGNRLGAYTLDGFGLANASIVYDAGNWSATLFATNLFDEYAETGVATSPQYNQVLTDDDGGDVNVRAFRINVAPPRAIGIRLNWDILPE